MLRELSKFKKEWKYVIYNASHNVYQIGENSEGITSYSFKIRDISKIFYCIREKEKYSERDSERIHYVLVGLFHDGKYFSIVGTLNLRNGKGCGGTFITRLAGTFIKIVVRGVCGFYWEILSRFIRTGLSNSFAGLISLDPNMRNTRSHTVSSNSKHKTESTYKLNEMNNKVDSAERDKCFADPDDGLCAGIKQKCQICNDEAKYKLKYSNDCYFIICPNCIDKAMSSVHPQIIKL